MAVEVSMETMARAHAFTINPHTLEMKNEQKTLRIRDLLGTHTTGYWTLEPKISNSSVKKWKQEYHEVHTQETPVQMVNGRWNVMFHFEMKLNEHWDYDRYAQSDYINIYRFFCSERFFSPLNVRAKTCSWSIAAPRQKLTTTRIAISERASLQ